MVETLKRDKLVATKQIRDYESRIQSLVSEHSLRITQLQSKWENISMESGHLKSMISVQKNKERERLDKISEVKIKPMMNKKELIPSVVARHHC